MFGLKGDRKLLGERSLLGKQDLFPSHIIRKTPTVIFQTVTEPSW